MKKNNKKNLILAREWFDKAKDDELSIKAILKEKGAPSTVCFLSRQMAEKHLKAFLVFHNKPFPKIHHLDRLLELCMKIDKSFEELKDETIVLSDYYVETRYPGGWSEEWSWKEAREAFDNSSRIKEFVLEKIKISI